jgi:anaerobic ribonucleoside-triphosphate reductase activating protein
LTELRIHSFVPTTEVEGPGRRACVWVQGCSIRCPGCFNTHMWARDTGFTVTVDELASRIVETTGIEGVTFLGGEPFEQAEALLTLPAECALQASRSSPSLATSTRPS